MDIRYIVRLYGEYDTIPSRNVKALRMTVEFLMILYSVWWDFYELCSFIGRRNRETHGAGYS